MGDDVRLVDLEVIKQYSLAVRQETAPADELLAALDASREAVIAAQDADGSGTARSGGTRSRSAKSTTSKGSAKKSSANAKKRTRK